MKKVKIGEVELAYYTRGRGKPLVMIMGFRGTMGQWDPVLLQELEKNYTLILFDHRGAGFSTDTAENLTTIQQMAEDATGLIHALNYDKVCLLGWSMGSRIAQEIALASPSLVEKLILCSPNPGGKYRIPSVDAFKRLTDINLSQDELLSLLFPETSEGRIAASNAVSRLTKAIDEGIIPKNLVISNQAIQRQAQALNLWNQSDAHFESLVNIQAPTLVANGVDDILDVPENARRVAHQIPYAWSAYFPNAGHAFLFQNPKPFSELVHLFLDIY